MPAVGPGLFHGHHVVHRLQPMFNPAPRRIVREETANVADLIHLMCKHC